MIKTIVVLLFFFLSFAPQIRAAYVLPYPSFMPGNKLYTVSKILDKAQRYWHFGSIAKVKYHMALADKYLVEAKTLFEYKQYLLATQALIRSNEQFQNVHTFLEQAQQEGKDVHVWQQMVNEQSVVHADVLMSLQEHLPKDFLWQPEKEKATQLSLGHLMQESISIRRAYD
jgi:hypothetical protein